MKISLIGLGLIGGSFSLALREKMKVERVYGVDQNPAHCSEALKRTIADEIVTLQEAVAKAELIIIAIPVDATKEILKSILDIVSHQVVMDVGSAKMEIGDAVNDHPNRKRFVATHPMWGTEYSGPAAATKEAFVNKAAVICNREESDPEAVELVESVYRALGMHIVNMKAAEHDIHAAYISHISHISSFALANTVLEKEKEDDNIFELASGGFESTARLAKSNPGMWVPIFMQNRNNVLDVLKEHIAQLEKFRVALQNGQAEDIKELINHANSIRRILK